MPLYESESIVLKSFNLAEADRIVVFLTRDHGVVRGVAKGAKRLKSRFGSTLEPFSTVQLSYFQKDERELVSIQQVELIRSCFETASEPAFLQTFSYITELLIAFAPPHDPNETLYRMVKACIDSEASESEDLTSIALYFELWLLRLGGYLPDWSSCRDCRRSFTVDEPASLQTGFALLCRTCGRAGGTIEISPLHRTVFHNVQKMLPMEFAGSARQTAAAVIETSSIMKRIAAQVLGRDVVGEKSLAVRL